MLLFLAAATVMLTGCKKDAIVFDHEQPQFEIIDNAILLEVIMPNGTSAKEAISIVGDFSGGEKMALTKAENSDKKWGIYLFESDFMDGKTLADGFYFISESNGEERTAKGDSTMHFLSVDYGTRTNVWVASWAAFHRSGDEPVPGKYKEIYLTGNVEGSNWDPANPIVMKMVGTDIFRAEVTFTDATSWFALSTAKGSWDAFNGARWGAGGALLTEGAPLDLVCDGTEQTMTIAAGTYTLTVNMVVNQIVIGNGNWDEPAGKYEHLYILGNVDGAGWEPAAPLEMKMVGRDLFRGEFTFTPAEGNSICYFCFATEKGDWDIVNANRWGAGNTEIKEEMYVPLVSKGEQNLTIAPGTYTITVNMIFKEAVIGNGDWSGREEPKDEEEEEEEIIAPDSVTTHFYFINETADMHYVYTYGTAELFAGWPGADWTTWQTATFLGQKLYCYEFTELRGFEVNGIINNNSGKQIEPAFKFEVGDQLDYFFLIGDEAVTELKPTPDKAEAIRRMFRK